MVLTVLGRPPRVVDQRVRGEHLVKRPRNHSKSHLYRVMNGLGIYLFIAGRSA